MMMKNLFLRKYPLSLPCCCCCCCFSTQSKFFSFLTRYEMESSLSISWFSLLFLPWCTIFSQSTISLAMAINYLSFFLTCHGDLKTERWKCYFIFFDMAQTNVRFMIQLFLVVIFSDYSQICHVVMFFLLFVKKKNFLPSSMLKHFYFEFLSFIQRYNILRKINWITSIVVCAKWASGRARGSERGKLKGKEKYSPYTAKSTRIILNNSQITVKSKVVEYPSYNDVL